MQAPLVLTAGTLFASDYRVVRPLGQGGMGAVYVVEQLSTGKLRALKLMLPQIAADAELRRRFEQEARIGAQIASDHVVDVQAAGVDAATKTPYLVMELLEGEDLAAYMRRRGHLDFDQLRAIFAELCHAVRAAHDAGIVHRDLKPENVFLATSRRADSADFTVKVLDFGIAKLASSATAGGATRAMGSPMWMSPEQTEDGVVTPAADVWSLGLLAFYLLTGKYFWKAAVSAEATMGQLFREIVFEPIPSATDRAREYGCADRLPPAFGAWFARCVVRDLGQRFANAGEMWRVLDNQLEPFAATMPGSPAVPIRPRVASSAPPPPTPQGATGAPVDGVRGSSAPPAEAVATPLLPVGLRGETPAPVSNTLGPSHASKSRVPMALAALVVLVGGGSALYLARSSRGHDAASPPAVSEIAAAASSVGSPATATPVVSAPPAPAASAAPDTPDASSVEARREESAAHRAATSGLRATSAPPRDVDRGSSTATAAPRTPAHFSLADDETGTPGTMNPHLATVAGHKVRLFGRVAKNEGNVSDAVVRKAVEWDAWQYLRCYDRVFAPRPTLPSGIVTVSFEVLDQLPRFAKVVSSDFAEGRFNDCVAGTLTSQTINAAGPEGKAKVTYAFRFLVMN